MRASGGLILILSVFILIALVVAEQFGVRIVELGYRVAP